MQGVITRIPQGESRTSQATNHRQCRPEKKKKKKKQSTERLGMPENRGGGSTVAEDSPCRLDEEDLLKKGLGKK